MENFITRFARYYTPVVVFAALALAVLVTDLHVLRVYLDQLAVFLNVGVVRANIHQAGDGAAGREV